MEEIPCIIVGNLLVIVIAVFFICLVVSILYHVSVCGWEAVGAVFFCLFIYLFGFCFVRKRNCELLLIGRNKWQ
jgi:hypothetical protein